MTQPHAVAVYTRPNCQPCAATKRRLVKNGTPFTEVDITQDRDAYDYVLELGHQQAPVVVLDDGRSWSGLNVTLIDSLKENHV